MSVICIPTSNTTAYDSVRGILAMAGAELDRLGHEVRMLDLTAPDLPSRLNALLPRRAETIAIGMSGIGLELYTDDRKLFWDAAQIPYFSWYCDHPSYFVRRHRRESRYVVQAYVFPDHAVFNRDYLQANGAVFAAISAFPTPVFSAACRPRKGTGGSFSPSPAGTPSRSNGPGARRCRQSSSPSCSTRSAPRAARHAERFPRSSLRPLPNISST